MNEQQILDDDLVAGAATIAAIIDERLKGERMEQALSFLFGLMLAKCDRIERKLEAQPHE